MPYSSSMTAPPPRMAVRPRPVPCARTLPEASRPALARLAGRTALPRTGCGNFVRILEIAGAVCVMPVLSLPASPQVRGLTRTAQMRGQGRGRTADLPLFRSRDHRPGTAMQVSAPAQRLYVPCDVPRCTRVNETQTETLRVATLAAAAARPPGQGRPHRTRFGTRAEWPARFPTLLADVHRGSPPSVTCAADPAAAGERSRTGVNETKTETSRRAADGWREHLRADLQ